jgi:hypothetical protein
MIRKRMIRKRMIRKMMIRKMMNFANVLRAEQEILVN